jgi:hypothetical protein
MSLAARKPDAKNHVSRSTKKSGSRTSVLNGPQHADERSITRVDAGQGVSETIGDPWTDAEMKMLSP